ncbi:uncharacterized protein JCM10292_005726 [Rhodotorula paludigena]|uniref:uncharacterized protein n=1 Tax=Rhodotorula paludigena TaxID=86838 RepID=UPI00316B2DA7
MPGLVTSLEATINFGVPKSELSVEEQAKYLARFDVNDPVPTRQATIPLHDLRGEVDAGMGGRTPLQQVEEMGFAVVKHASEVATYDGLDTPEATDAYKEECVQLYKDILGADEVIAWNAVIRDAGEGQPDTFGKQQLKVEKDFAPAANPLKAIAGSAHVDQDEEYARTIVKRAAGDDAFERYSRCCIINLWRPLRVVTNNPLAVSDFRTMDVDKDIMRMAGSYGTAYSVAHSPSQKWCYVQHQQPDEALMLLCYDSNMGKNGEALYTGHVACKVLNEPKPEGVEEIARRSVEVRLFAFFK